MRLALVSGSLSTMLSLVLVMKHLSREGVPLEAYPGLLPPPRASSRQARIRRRQQMRARPPALSRFLGQLLSALHSDGRVAARVKTKMHLHIDVAAAAAAAEAEAVAAAAAAATASAAVADKLGEGGEEKKAGGGRSLPARVVGQWICAV